MNCNKATSRMKEVSYTLRVSGLFKCDQDEKYFKFYAAKHLKNLAEIGQVIVSYHGRYNT